MIFQWIALSATFQTIWASRETEEKTFATCYLHTDLLLVDIRPYNSIDMTQTSSHTGVNMDRSEAESPMNAQSHIHWHLEKYNITLRFKLTWITHSCLHVPASRNLCWPLSFQDAAWPSGLCAAETPENSFSNINSSAIKKETDELCCCYNFAHTQNITKTRVICSHDKAISTFTTAAVCPRSVDTFLSRRTWSCPQPALVYI